MKLLEYQNGSAESSSPKYTFKGIRSYRGTKVKDESEGLPFKDLPTHLQADSDDETTLEAGYARLGVGDIDASEDKDGNDITK